MDIKEFEDLLVIRKSTLDDELAQHSDVLYRIGKQVVKLSELHAAATDEFKKAEAEAYAALKTAVSDGKPLSDKAVEMATRNDPYRLKAWTAMIAAKTELDTWEKLYDSWVVKGHNMKSLAGLYQTNTFSVALPYTGQRKDYTAEPPATRRSAR
jgi:hypothetical protein